MTTETKTKPKKDAPALVRVMDLRNLELPLLTPSSSDDSATKIDKRESKVDLVRALTEALYGELVPVVAFEYEKDASKPEGRVANEDYLSIPGTDDTFHMGQIVSVARSRKGNIYFKMRDLARADGTKPWSWTCVRPDRIVSFQYRGAFPNPNHGKPRTGEWTGKR